MNFFTLIINSAVFLLLPTYLIKLPLFPGASLPLLDILLLLAIGANFKIIQKNKLRFKPTFQFNLVWFGVFLILTAFVINIILNFNQSDWTNSLGLLKSFFILPILFAFSLNLLIQGKQKKIQLLWWHFFLGSIFVSVFAFLDFWNNKLTFDQRLQSFYNSPNSLAFTLSTGFLIGFYLIKKRFFLTKTACSLISVLLLLQLFLLWQTQSTGALIGVMGTIILLFLIQSFPKYKNIFLTFLFIAPFIVLFLLLNSVFISAQLNYTPLSPPSSLDSRLAIYQSAKKIWQDHFWLGVGLSNFQDSYLANQKFFTPYPQWAVPHAHNLLFQFAVEGGVISLVGITLILFSFFCNQKKRLRLSVFLLMSYFLLHGLADMPIWKNDLAVIFWFIIFSIFSLKKVANKIA